MYYDPCLVEIFLSKYDGHQHWPSCDPWLCPPFICNAYGLYVPMIISRDLSSSSQGAQTSQETCFHLMVVTILIHWWAWSNFWEESRWRILTGETGDPIMIEPTCHSWQSFSLAWLFSTGRYITCMTRFLPCDWSKCFAIRLNLVVLLWFRLIIHDNLFAMWLVHWFKN